LTIKKLIVVLITVIAFTVSQEAQAQFPKVVPYQGTIADTGGIPYSGSFSFIFKLQDENGDSME